MSHYVPRLRASYPESLLVLAPQCEVSVMIVRLHVFIICCLMFTGRNFGWVPAGSQTQAAVAAAAAATQTPASPTAAVGRQSSTPAARADTVGPVSQQQQQRQGVKRYDSGVTGDGVEESAEVVGGDDIVEEDISSLADDEF